MYKTQKNAKKRSFIFWVLLGQSLKNFLQADLNHILEIIANSLYYIELPFSDLYSKSHSYNKNRTFT